MTADHFPHVHEPGPGVLAYLGCNGRGVALATAMGQQLSRRLIAGETAEIDMPITGLKPIRIPCLLARRREERGALQPDSRPARALAGARRHDAHQRPGSNRNGMVKLTDRWEFRPGSAETAGPDARSTRRANRRPQRPLNRRRGWRPHCRCGSRKGHGDRAALAVTAGGIAMEAHQMRADALVVGRHGGCRSTGAHRGSSGA